MHCQKLNTYMETGRVVFLPFSAISPNPSQPRTTFSEDALEELAQSIRRHGGWIRATSLSPGSGGSGRRSLPG